MAGVGRPWVSGRAGAEREAGNRRFLVISIFEYVDGTFQLNVWGIIFALLLFGALGSRATRK